MSDKINLQSGMTKLLSELGCIEQDIMNSDLNHDGYVTREEFIESQTLLNPDLLPSAISAKFDYCFNCYQALLHASKLFGDPSSQVELKLMSSDPKTRASAFDDESFHKLPPEKITWYIVAGFGDSDENVRASATRSIPFASEVHRPSLLEFALRDRSGLVTYEARKVLKSIEIEKEVRDSYRRRTKSLKTPKVDKHNNPPERKRILPDSPGSLRQWLKHK